MNNHHHVLLLKNPDSDTDPYTSVLASHGIASSIIPTLSHTYTDPSRLADVIGRGGGNEYGGVIVTSGRAVDAWENVLNLLRERDVNDGVGWGSIPFYVVGPRTKSQILDLRAKTPDKISRLLPSPDLILGVKEAGTGEALARFISIDYPARNKSKQPLLYMVGDKNAGGVEGVLKEVGIGVEMVQVYATVGSETFEQDFEQAVSEVKEGETACVAFFAPSSAELALPTIRKHFAVLTASPSQENITTAKPLIRVAAIGPTTARALSAKHSIVVDVVSEKPEPNALAEAIVSLSSG
ncbi:hypothetical protein FRC07_006099 [Ceratobasidium sp. 392]|nr:hypothetical protein FRC07_006099 [Ceratobasidium sp. 392]